MSCFDNDAKINSQFYNTGGCSGIHWENPSVITLYNDNRGFTVEFYSCDTYYKTIPSEFLLYNSDNPNNLKYMKYSALFSYIVKYNPNKLHEVLKMYNVNMKPIV